VAILKSEVAVDDDDRRCHVRKRRLRDAGRLRAVAQRDGAQPQAERVAAAEAEEDVGLSADRRPDQLAQLRVLRERGPRSSVRGFETLLFCGRRRLPWLARKPRVEAAERGRHACRCSEDEQRCGECQDERPATEDGA
jgi:hypothetical protein